MTGVNSYPASFNGSKSFVTGGNLRELPLVDLFVNVCVGRLMTEYLLVEADVSTPGLMMFGHFSNNLGSCLEDCFQIWVEIWLDIGVHLYVCLWYLRKKHWKLEHILIDKARSTYF